jgi:predicted regulator of Ras-like GTPase activity (Roadblock/LC7/MglB family)
MFTLPQLIEEDLKVLNAALSELIQKSEANAALLTDKAGFRLVEQGDVQQIDTTTLAALASGSFMATQEIARIIDEPNFSSVYQQGVKHSLFVCNVDDYTVLVVIFPAQITVGVVKYYATASIKNIADQLQVAKNRAPGEGIDLAMMNLAESPDIFKRKS